MEANLSAVEARGRVCDVDAARQERRREKLSHEGSRGWGLGLRVEGLGSRVEGLGHVLWGRGLSSHRRVGSESNWRVPGCYEEVDEIEVVAAIDLRGQRGASA
eukprot:3941263-Rhodomonas_salina.1